MLKQIHIFSFTSYFLLIKDAPSWAQLMNDIDSSLTNTNDSILTHILLFGQASLDISANTLIINARRQYIISTKRFQESYFSVFRNSLLYFHLFNFFRILIMSFCDTIRSYSFGFKVCFYLFINIFFFLHSLFCCTQVSLEY